MRTDAAGSSISRPPGGSCWPPPYPFGSGPRPVSSVFPRCPTPIASGPSCARCPDPETDDDWQSDMRETGDYGRDNGLSGGEEHGMDEDTFNMGLRKFLKVVGVTSQREI